MEYDRLNPLTLGAVNMNINWLNNVAEQSAIQSMQSSKYKIVSRWSTPSFVGTYSE